MKTATQWQSSSLSATSHADDWILATDKKIRLKTITKSNTNQDTDHPMMPNSGNNKDRLLLDCDYYLCNIPNKKEQAIYNDHCAYLFSFCRGID